mgnify:CR=1 FL=1
MTPAGEPFIVHCGKCRHEWALGFCPMLVDTAVKVMKRPCPACGSRKVYAGPVPRPTAQGDVVAWIDHGDTGVSSETIWYALHLRMRRPKGVDVPYDPEDFGRCYRLLQVMPAWKARLQEVVVFCPAWAPLVAAWERLTTLYEEELPTGKAPRLYARMQQLRGETS